MKKESSMYRCPQCNSTIYTAETEPVPCFECAYEFFGFARMAARMEKISEPIEDGEAE